MTSLGSIKDNFFNESSDLNSYLEYVEAEFVSNTRVFYADVFCKADYQRLMNIVKGFLFDTDDDTVETENQNKIDEILGIIESQIQKNQEFISEHPEKFISEDLKSAAIIQNNPEILEILRDSEPDEFTPETLKEFFDKDPEGEPYYGMYTVDDYKKYLEYAELVFYNEKTTNTIENNRYLRAKKTIFLTMKKDWKANIYRQVFIMLLTIFDATITDFFSYLLNNDLFGVIKNVNSDKSYRMKDIAAFSTVDELKEDIINSIVESNKIHSIMKILVQYNPSLFVINGDDIKNKLFEILSRRNIHVHKRGIIDQAYFNQAAGNPYNLSIGDYATITQKYYNDCYETIHLFVDNLS